MQILIILAVSLSILTAYYFLILQPSKRIKKFAQNAQNIGYKVKHMPYQFMTYFLIKYLRKDQKSLKIFKEDYKDYDLIVGNMFTSLAVVFENEELLKDFFAQLSKFPKNPFFAESFQLLNGGGIVFSEGQSWKRKRRIISTVFHFDFLNDMIPAINEQVQKQFVKINKLILEDQKVNILKSAMKILSSVIARSFFGTNMEEYIIEGKPYFDYFNEYLNEMMSFNTSLEHFLFGMKVYNFGLSRQSRNLKRKHQLLSGIAKEIILKELQKIKKGQLTQKNILTALYQGGLLNVDLEESKPNQYNLYDLVGEFFTFFSAGTDTTAHSVNTAIHYLSENPSYQQQIRDQLEVLEKNTTFNETEKVKNMKWIEAVFNQTLRLNGPIGYLMIRTSTEDTQVGKLSIPKGSCLTMMPMLMHYKDKNFDEASVFKPQKWMNDKPTQPFTYVPFGGGQRNCIGQYLARIEAKILISKILTKYEIKAEKTIKMRAAFQYGNVNTNFEMKLRQKQLIIQGFPL